MLGPIALYPDPLIAQVLPAATTPDQVAAADRYLRTGGDVLQVEYQSWEPSVKAITRYPEVVRMMGGNLRWTTDMGIAFVNQETDVMDSIQRLRAQARAIGNLQTTPQQVVIVEERLIQIVPASPQIIFVPVYSPEIVYVRPPPRVGVHLVFGPPLPIGPWMNHDLNWRHREVIVWREDHPRPHDWWYEPPSRHEHTTVVNNTTIVNNYTVYQPRNRPALAPKGPAVVQEREGQARNGKADRRETQTRQANGPVTNHLAGPTPPVAKPGTTAPKQVSERTVRQPNQHSATNVSVNTPRPAAAATNTHPQGTVTSRRPGPAEAKPQPYHPPQAQGQSNSIPLFIETHSDPVPATISSPHERANVPQAKQNPNAHAGGAASPVNKVAAEPAKPEKKGKAEAKGKVKKASEHDSDSGSSTNRQDQPK